MDGANPSSELRALTARAPGRESGFVQGQGAVGDPELHDALMKIAAHYNCSMCVLALRRHAHVHIVGICKKGHLVFEKDSHVLDEEKFQLFHHHLRRPLPIIVYDAAADRRLSRDGCVVGHPHVRFYAAAPILFADQERREEHGTLCIVDNKPKAGFSLMEAEYLCEQATAVASLVERLRADCVPR
eukprot:TRINITY_DN55101_c0_g1_i1.p1 TRINITY_DN55101_c0_g1~~TRINITY_DN55101_c0_g1_i1.p1  ORF type:complete len:186 (-),score=27.99 TRINITY_DN55101_c0_g1_i1:252-809(-)